MKHCFFFLLAIAFALQLWANPLVDGYRWSWAISAGGTGNDIAEDVAYDFTGNIYIVGCIENTATFGNMVLASAGGEDIFIAKADSEGNWIWAVSAGGNGMDHAFGVCADPAGNCYVTGYFEGTASFGSTVLTSSGAQDIFVCMLDPSGNWLWAAKAGGDGYDAGFGVDVGDNQICHVSGAFSTICGCDQLVLTSAGQTDIFLGALGVGGNWLWVNRAGGPGEDVGRRNKLDAAGNSYICGWFQDTSEFGSEIMASFGSFDAFAAKTDSFGNWSWCEQAGGTGDDRAFGIYTYPDGSSKLCGSFHNVAQFGGDTASSLGGYDLFIADILPQGGWGELFTYGFSDNELCYDIERPGDYLDSPFEFINTSVIYTTSSSQNSLMMLVPFLIKDIWSNNIDEEYLLGTLEGSYQDAKGLVTVDGSLYFVCGGFNYYASFQGFHIDEVYNVASYGEQDIFLARAEYGIIQHDDVPVELTSFSAITTSSKSVQLSWTVQSETQMLGYLVYRSTSSEQQNSLLISPVMIPAMNSSYTHDYSFIDQEVDVGGTYYYWLEGIEQSSSTYYGPVSVTVEAASPPELPTVTQMQNPYPNPFHSPGEINITVSIKENETGAIRIINLRGQILREYDLTEGYHTIYWDGSDRNGTPCGNGIYYVILSTPSAILKNKIMMFK
jgi:hypothetical protein